MHKTRVALSPDYIGTHADNGKRINRYAWFSHKFWDNNGNCFYVFYLDRNGQNSIANKYASCVKIRAGDIENAIIEIVKEVAQPDAFNVRFSGLHEDLTPIKDTEVPELMVAWVVFIAFLLFTLMFKQFYLICPIAGFILDKIRRDMLNQ